MDYKGTHMDASHKQARLRYDFRRSGTKFVLLTLALIKYRRLKHACLYINASMLGAGKNFMYRIISNNYAYGYLHLSDMSS